jgi:NAD(P)-dependent dehydrogenase (short-subunit alcohol dehydrogenase family)
MRRPRRPRFVKDPFDDAGARSVRRGQQVPLSRAGQPKELAPAFVLLASDEASYISGAVVPVTGGKPML